MENENIQVRLSTLYMYAQTKIDRFGGVLMRTVCVDHEPHPKRRVTEEALVAGLVALVGRVFVNCHLVFAIHFVRLLVRWLQFVIPNEHDLESESSGI